MIVNKALRFHELICLIDNKLTITLKKQQKHFCFSGNCP